MKKRILVLLKRSAYDLYVACHQEPNFTSFLSQERVVGNLLDRHKVHEHSVRRCKDILTQRGLIWDCLLRDELKTQIHNADLIVTVGGDGTLLQASHYVDSSIPILGLNSDPTWKDEVEVQIEQFDATRSRGFLCLATAENFGEVLDEILEDKRHSMELKRISVSSNGSQILPPVLNDVLLAHPNPASVSRCSFRVDKEGGDSVTPFIHSRSSGLRICTGAGSTAAMQSAGGYPMRILSQDLQYMVREPLLPHPMHKKFLHGWIHDDETLYVRWSCRQGAIYIDGSHVVEPIKFGSIIEISTKAPSLQIYLEPESC